MKYPYIKYTEQRKTLDSDLEKLKDLVFYKTNKELAEIYNTSIPFISNYLYDNKITRDTTHLSEKVCTKCRTLKKVEEFAWANVGRRWTCIKCENERSANYYNKNKEIASMYSKNKYRTQSPALNLFRSSKQRAKLKKFEFDLTVEFLEQKWKECNGCCQLTGVEFDNLIDTKPTYNRPSLDRIDSKKGYTKDNVRIILFGLNLNLNVFGLDAYLETAKLILKKQGAKIS